MASNGYGSKATAYSTSLQRVIKLFFVWKSILLAAACASPGPGYDTSTQILLNQYSPHVESPFGRVVEHVVLRLTRWDAIYFSSLATRGHVNEQEWAFSWALAKTTSLVARVFLPWTSLSPIVKNALAGIIISSLSHLLAVIALYHLTFNLVPSSRATSRQIAFIAACLHTISPAGLFLSAPYGESTFAFFNFSGMLSYLFAAKAQVSKTSPLNAASWMLVAGACFGIAAMMRGNGLLSGILFAWDAPEMIIRPSKILHSWEHTSRFVIIIFAGLLVAIGFATPQVVAYVEYCTGGNTRPWCSRLPPSIYSWVQEHYWEVGLFKYWTLSNLPLFLLAGPMLGVLVFTAYVALRWPDQIVSSCTLRVQEWITLADHQRMFTRVIRRLALPQLVLAVMAATSFHVQIINRISSGYPVWYIVLAIAIFNLQVGHINTAPSSQNQSAKPAVDSDNVGRKNDGDTKGTPTQGWEGSWWFSYLRGKHLEWIVRGMAVYAVVQGGLYAAFLPPA